MAEIEECVVVAADSHGKLIKCNDVPCFDMVRPSALESLFCDTNFVFFEITMHQFQRGDRPQLWPGIWRLVVIAAGGVFRRAGHGPRADVAAGSAVVSDVRLVQMKARGVQRTTAGEGVSGRRDWTRNAGKRTAAGPAKGSGIPTKPVASVVSLAERGRLGDSPIPHCPPLL